MLCVVLAKLNELEDSIVERGIRPSRVNQAKRKRYIIAKLRPLKWTELTPQQQAWVEETKARHRSPIDETVA